MPSLLEPHQLGELTLPNRVIMAPMTRARALGDGRASPVMATYYAQRASAGLIISEGIFPSAESQSNAGAPGLSSAAHTASWRPITQAVHVNGGRIFAQLQHGGRVGHPAFAGHQPVGPSAVAVDGDVPTPQGMQPAVVPRELSVDDIRAEIQVIASAARRAMDAGFDGVELHGANGYLIHQFLSSNANQRSDHYGASVTGRIRFAVELAEAVSDAIGADRVGLRLSPGGPTWDIVEDDTPKLYRTLLSALAPVGLAYVHVLDTSDVDTLMLMRKTWPGTFMVNPGGQWLKPEQAQQSDHEVGREWLGRGADLVSFARAYLANPDLVERFRQDLPLRPAPAQNLWYGGGIDGLIAYPTHAHSQGAS